MSVRIFSRSLAIALLVVLSLPRLALAVASDAQIVVRVKDAQSGAPMPLVQVVLHGPTSLAGLTGDSGEVVFENVPAGTYSGSAQKIKYQPTPIQSIEVRSGETTTISVTLSEILKMIGSVVTARAQTWSPSNITREDPRALGAASLTDSLSNIPGALIDDNGTGSSYLSVDGHSSSQTVVLAEGIPIAPPSTGVNLRSIGADLFDGADVQSASTGAVDFHIPDPTLAYSFSAQNSYSTYGSSSLSAFSRGTAGRIGYSLGYSIRGLDSDINGQTFLDQSGLAYQHDAGSLNRAGVVKLRVPLSSQQVMTLIGLSSQYEADDQCSIIAGALPCGNGPGNFSYQRLNSWQAKYAATSGQVNLSLTAFGSTVGGVVDDNQRTVNGQAEPIFGSYDARTGGFTGSAALYSRALTQLSSSFMFYSTNAAGSGVVSGVTAPTNQPTERFGRFGVIGATEHSSRVRSNVEIGLNGATGSVLTPYTNTSISLRPSSRQTISLSYDAGVLAPAVSSTQGFALPSFLTFDCSAKTVFGTAPSTTLAPAESSEASLSYGYKGPGYSFDASAYHQVMHGAILNGIVGGQFLSPTIFPPNYLSDVSSFFATGAGCGYAATLASDNLSLSLNEQGTGIFEGYHIAGHVNMRPRIILDLYYSTTVAHATDTIFGSTFAPSQQLLGVPIQRMGLAVDYKPGNGNAEILGTIQRVSSNNANNLPAYTVVGAATKIPLLRGAIVASVSNLFDQFAPTFGSTAEAISIPRVGATAVRPIAIPLAPRTFQLRYQVRVGGLPPAPTNGSSSDFGLPTSATLNALPLTNSDPNPYAIAVDSPQCGPEQVALIQPVIEAIHKYAERGRYIESEALPLGETLLLRKGESGAPGFLVSGTRPAVETALFSCMIVHAGSAARAVSLGLVAPTDNDKNFDMLFSPVGGFYVTTDNLHVVRREVTLLTFSGTPDPDPFAIRANSSSCTSDMKDAAAYLLGDLRTRFAQGSVEHSDDGLTVVKYGNANPSFEIRFDDPTYRTSILSCGRVYAVTPAKAIALGITSGDATVLNFSNKVGLYVIVP